MQDEAHPAQIVLERYAMNGLSDQESEVVEDHVALCTWCQSQIEEAVAFTKDFRHILEIEPRTASKQPFLWGWFNWQNSAWAGGAVAIALLIILLLPSKPLGPVAFVSLVGTRGVSTLARGPGPFEFEMFMPETAPAYQVVMVDSNGQKVWESSVSPRAGKLRAMVPKRLNPGEYFIRVSVPASSAIHEYGLRVER